MEHIVKIDRVSKKYGDKGKGGKVGKASVASVLKAPSISRRRSPGQTPAVLVAEEGLNVRLK